MHIRPLLLSLFTVLGHLCTAQSHIQTGSGQVEILNADLWEYDTLLAAGAQRLKGNVRFKHADALMHCDSAYLYKDQRVEAFSRVGIDQGDTLHVDADRLKYNGQDRMAHLEGNVHLRDRDMELSTPTLDYDMRARRAVYLNGGHLVSRSDGNTLSSGTGVYLADQRRFIFGRDVRLQHPDRSIVTDTMHYVTSTGVAEFFGPTDIRQAGTTIHTLRGTYDTRNERARFSKRSSVLSKGRLLEGDSLHYDRHAGTGLAWGNVAVIDTASDLIARGDFGRYNEIEDRSMITGHAELVMLLGGDSLFLHGDTLFTALDSTGTGKRVQAHRHVRFFKTDLQGACDTLIYNTGDSLIRMFHTPILWNGTDQITGDHIRIQLKDGMAHRLFVLKNAFLMSQADSTHFDQVTGTTMTGFFANNVLHRIIAEGNSRTVYFAREEKEGKEAIVGVNRADCSRIEVTLADGKVSTVSFLERPEAVLYPLDKAPPEELHMQGADWRGGERPTDRAGIFTPMPETPSGSLLQPGVIK
ncbi:MAG: OstA-like protein [Flavobacteriales bacterium]